LATPNYGYEKRQKELAKKRKKEDKLKAKAERKLDPHGNELPDTDEAENGSTEASPQTDASAS